MLPGTHSGQLSLISWRARGSPFSWANRPLPRPALPLRPAVRRLAPTRPWYLRPLGSPGFPGYALHEKVLQRQKGVGPPPSSQSQRALLVQRFNRLSSGCQPLVNRLSTARLVPPSFYMGFRLFVLLESRSGDTSSMLSGVRGKLVSFRGELFCRRPTLPGPNPLPGHAPRPDPNVVCPGFGFDK